MIISINIADAIAERMGEDARPYIDRIEVDIYRDYETYEDAIYGRKQRRNEDER